MRTRVAIGCAAIGLTMAVGLLAACGGDGGATANAAPSGAAAGFQAYVDCLRKNGVNITMPSGRPSGRPSGVRPSGRPSGVRPSGRGGFPGFPGGGFGNVAPSGVDPSTWDAAQQACAGLRPSFGRGGRGDTAFQAYRNCLSEHGVTASGGPGGFDPADPKVAAAMATCAPLRPSGRPSGP